MFLQLSQDKCRGGSRNAATSKMERFVTIVNSFQPLTIITMRSILDVAAVLDPPLEWYLYIVFIILRFLSLENKRRN